MDDLKLKKAFGKVKKDIFTIAGEVEKIKSTLKDFSKKTPAQKSDSKVEILSEKISIDKKKQNAEIAKLSEQSRINLDRISSLKRHLESLESEIKKLTPYTKTDIKDLEKSVKNANKEIENHSSNIKIINDKLDDFTEIIDEKVLLEMENTKQDILKEIDNYQKTENNELSDLSELIQEKINLEISALRLEFTDEIAKIYDKFFSEIIELKENSKDKSQKNKDTQKASVQTFAKVKAKDRKEEIETEPQVIDSEDKEPKEGIMKKFTRWLFIDYEEEEDEYDMQDVKSEVKEEKEKPKKQTKKQDKKDTKKDTKKKSTKSKK